MGAHSAASQLGLRYLTSAFHLLSRVDDDMVAGGLSLARAKVLDVLDRVGPLRQGALAAELGLAARSVTQAVEGLERDGFIHRTADPDDGRVKIVRLTAPGSEALAAAWTVGETVFEEIFGGLGPERLADLDGLLDAVDAAVGHRERGRS